MASVARELSKTFLLFSLIFNLNADAHIPLVYPKKVEVSDHWEKDGITYQDKHITEVIIKQGVSYVRLVCKIDPPLPKTEEHFRFRDSLVRFEKIYPEEYVLTGLRYWSDGMHTTAVALDVRKVDLFGTYTCFYGGMKTTVDILAESEEILKALPSPVTLENMMSTTFVKKYFMDNIQLPSKTALPVIGETKLNCEAKQPKFVAKSVHGLTASDIRVVASLGDSILIGLGAMATTKSDFFTEYRGVSWSNGGDSTLEVVLTLPNIIKRFSPQLRGYSTSIARHYENNSGFNVATVPSTSRDLEKQAHQLISKIRRDKKVDFKEDWKLVTIMSGTRDLCRICEEKDDITPDVYIQSIVKTLDILQSKMPKTFVNFVLPLNVSSLYDLTTHGNCMMGNWSICPCLKYEFMRRKISNFYEGYKNLAYELIDSGVYDGSDDFTVVVQPVFEDSTFHVQDRDLFSMDCLHFSAKGNALAAVALWNNMVQPVNMKHSRWRGQQTINCSTEDSPYFSTKINSKTKAKPDRILDSEYGMSSAIYVAVTVAVIFAIALIAAFIYLKHKLRTPITKLKFSNKPWIKYSI